MKPFVTLDIETWGTPGLSNFVAMPSYAFVILSDINSNPTIIRGLLNKDEQIKNGAVTTGSTIEFWMKMAMQDNQTALQVMGRKNHFLFAFGDTIIHRDTASDAETLKLTLAAIEQNSDVFNDTMFYGNGPEFDMRIYSAHSIYNEVEDPYKYWLLGNVRTLREEFINLGFNYKELEKVADNYAFEIIKNMGLIKHGVVPSKHDPVFDALVEAFVIYNIKHTLSQNRIC